LWFDKGSPLSARLLGPKIWQINKLTLFILIFLCLYKEAQYFGRGENEKSETRMVDVSKSLLMPSKPVRGSRAVQVA